MARKTKAATKGRKAKRASAGPTLRRIDQPFEERRFEPAASRQQYLGVILMSLGAIALGAGFYVVALRDEAAEPIAWAPWLMAAGFVCLVLYFILGQAKAPVLRVGDFGVGIEQGERVARTGWYQLRKVTLEKGTLSLKPAGAAILVPLQAHPAAARRIAFEARQRIPERVELDEADLQEVGTTSADEGELVPAEPPQVTNMTCAHSERPLTFERDVRMCTRCGAFYHRAGVPARCVECERKLQRR